MTGNHPLHSTPDAADRLTGCYCSHARKETNGKYAVNIFFCPVFFVSLTRLIRFIPARISTHPSSDKHLSLQG